MTKTKHHSAPHHIVSTLHKLVHGHIRPGKAAISMFQSLHPSVQDALAMQLFHPVLQSLAQKQQMGQMQAPPPPIPSGFPSQ